MPLHWQEVQQGKQGLSFKPQNEKVAIRKPSIQENLVGGRQTIRETEVVNKGHKDH